MGRSLQLFPGPEVLVQVSGTLPNWLLQHPSWPPPLSLSGSGPCPCAKPLSRDVTPTQGHCVSFSLAGRPKVLPCSKPARPVLRPVHANSHVDPTQISLTDLKTELREALLVRRLSVGNYQYI